MGHDKINNDRIPRIIWRLLSLTYQIFWHDLTIDLFKNLERNKSYENLRAAFISRLMGLWLKNPSLGEVSDWDKSDPIAVAQFGRTVYGAYVKGVDDQIEVNLAGNFFDRIAANVLKKNIKPTIVKVHDEMNTQLTKYLLKTT